MFVALQQIKDGGACWCFLRIQDGACFDRIQDGGHQDDGRVCALGRSIYNSRWRVSSLKFSVVTLSCIIYL